MQRTTIVAPEELLDRLRRHARDRNTSLASVIREALEEKADQCRPMPRSMGIVSSGYTDTARLAGEIGFIPDPWR